ncbi:hypothetical protein ASZ78_006943 [Callipepla squamata]|uniref:ATR-interacting protein n=1 Tax=Callipepla squamata TaxID=9009 RepID=A0A226MSB3_CALSU|nr:hypothetical protein ASZ78_006943 [Callipepla squamata]
MAAQPPLGPRKRSAGVGAALAEDPFGDSDDFTADDLEEIDTIASQALSPKKNFAIQMKSEGCSQQPGKRSFPTKESFNAETAARPSSSSGNCFAQTSSSKEVDGKATPKTISPGSALLSTLLKQPLVPGSLLGLCHLLSSSTEALPGALLQPDLLETQPTQMPGTRTAQEEVPPLVSLQEAQKLAVTGLNLIAMDDGLSEGSPAGSGSEVLYQKHCKIRGAVHLLPLVEHHIGAYCRAVQSADKSVNASCGNHSVVSSRTSTNKVSSKEDYRLSLEETTVLSLGVLYYLVFYSWDVVHTLLSNEVGKSSTGGEEQITKADKNVLCDSKEDDRTEGGLPEAPRDAASNVQTQHSLFRKLLQVLAFSATAGSRTDGILQQSLKVLVKLAENSTLDLLINLSQKDKLFHEHCLEVLHQYDQAMPGIRAILRKTKKLSACEELILDELYPPEPEAEDQGMDSS